MQRLSNFHALFKKYTRILLINHCRNLQLYNHPGYLKPKDHCHALRSPYGMKVPVESFLEKTITKDFKLGQISEKVFKQLCEASDSSLHDLHKRTWGGLFYCLNKNTEYDKLDMIIKRAKDLGINCGEGAYTTLVHCYIQREKVKKAHKLLVKMKKQGLVRHSRTYFAVITALADNGYVTEAFEMFKEMQGHVFKSNKTVSLVVPASMAISLIKSCITKQDTYKPVSYEHYEKAKYVLQYYNNSGHPLTLDIIKAINEWLSNDPVNKWQINECEISTKGLCNNCQEFLNNAATLGNTETLQNLILNTVERIFEEEQSKKLMRFRKYQKFLQDNGPYEIIIDGMNVGLSVGSKKLKRNFNSRILWKIVQHFLNQNKKILVLVNTSVPPLRFLENHQIFVSDVGHDDFYLIYACAFSSSMSHIVTKDKLREHRFLLDLQNHSQYLQWVRVHTISVEVCNNTVSFKTNHFDVVQEGKTGWHFPVNDGKWFCAQIVS